MNHPARRPRVARFVGAAALGLGLLLIFGPHNLFHICADRDVHMQLANGMKAPMRCTWTTLAEQGVGGLVALTGLVLLGWRPTGATRPMSALLAGMGLLVILLPATVMGMCPTPTMPCNVSAKPAFYLLGGLVALTALAGLVFGRGERSAPAA